MDYEVFILSRIKEAHDAGKSTDEAVVDGLGHTGRLVTSAAIILFLAFAALAAGPDVQIKVFATGMAVGIVLDATVVRALLVPALVSLLGRWNWWLPWARSDGAAEELSTNSGEESVVMAMTATSTASKLGPYRRSHVGGVLGTPDSRRRWCPASSDQSRFSQAAVGPPRPRLASRSNRV